MSDSKAKQFTGVRMVDGKHILVKTTDWDKLVKQHEKMERILIKVRSEALKDWK